MNSEYLNGAARSVWDQSIANVYTSRAKEQSLASTTGVVDTCESCDTIIIPGITCTLRTVTSHNQNKKLRTKKQKKLAKYLEECQKHTQFETRRQVKVEYRCQCLHKFTRTTLVPKPKTNKVAAPAKTQSKSQAARERSKKRRNNTVDNQANLMASLSKPSLSLTDFLM